MRKIALGCIDALPSAWCIAVLVKHIRNPSPLGWLGYVNVGIVAWLLLVNMRMFFMSEDDK